MINQMEESVFSEELKTAFSETEMEAAKQLVQLSEEDTLSCSSGTGWSVCGCDCGRCEGGDSTKRQEEVVSDDMVGKEQNDGVWMIHKNVTDGQGLMKAIMDTKIRRNKKKKFRSLANIYRATKEMAC